VSLAERLERPVVAVAAVAAVVWWALVPTYPNYDAYYHLVWGREVLDGALPSFEAYAAPTPHPLELAVTTLLAPFDAADRVLVLVTLLALVALAWGTWRLGLALFGPGPAALATLFVGSSFAFLLYAVRAYVDVPFLALVVWAAALEVRATGRAPLLLLLAAGLLRPEGWLLAGLLALRRRSLAAAALAVAAPLLWAFMDLVVTGDPLHSVRATSALAEDLGRERGIARVPGAFVSFLADVARPPVALAGVVGLVLAVRRFGARAMAVPLALLGAGVLTYVGTGLAGLAILPRYLTVPAVALCVFAGFAVAGFTTLRPGDRLRGLWARGAAVAAVGAVAFLAVKLPSFATLAAELRFGRDVHRDLVALLATPHVRAGMDCGVLTFPNYRLVPDARFILRAPRGAVGARSARRRERGVAVFVHGARTLRRYGFADGASVATNVPDAGFVPVVRRGRFTAYASCPLRATTSPSSPPAGPRSSLPGARGTSHASPSARTRSHRAALWRSAVWARAQSRSSTSGRTRSPARARSAATNASASATTSTARAHVRTPARSGETVRRPRRAYFRMR
jgi:hypothetical protein